MNAQLIEKLDKTRYNAWLLETIGFVVWIGAFIFRRSTGIDSTLFDIAIGAGVTLFLTGAVMKKVVNIKMQRDDRVRQMLNNELYVQYGYKTYTWGFYGMLVALLILIVTPLSDVTLTCIIAIFAGVLVQRTATLIYFGRDGKNSD